jgi:hypothetical protein
MHLYAATPRLDWRRLLQRTFAIDLTRCPKCSGPMRVLDAIHDTSVAHAILVGLGVSTEVPRRARARDPTDVDVETSECDEDDLG